MSEKFKVGDTVIVTDVNYKGFKEATVTKVGRSLVYVDKDIYGRGNSAYRLDSGVRNGSYQHGRIWTVEDYRENTRRGAIISILRDSGFHIDRNSGFSTEVLEKISEIITEEN